MTGHKLQFSLSYLFEVPILLNPPPTHTHTNACFDRSAFGIFDVITSNIVLRLRPDVVTFNEYRYYQGSGKRRRYLIQIHMSLIVRKPVLVVSDQVRHKPGCTVTEHCSHRIGGNRERRVLNNFSFSIAKISVFDCQNRYNGNRKRLN